MAFKILLIGHTGFVGRNMASRLESEKINFQCSKERLSPDSDWSKELKDINVVINTAGLAHNKDKSPIHLHQVNDQGIENLCKCIEDQSSVSAIIHLSSIAASGLFESGSTKITESNGRVPEEPYGLSKLNGERHVEKLVKTGKCGINLRPPLIYGPEAPGNWSKLCKLASLPIPLPFKCIDNRRSFLSVENLCDFIISRITAGNLSPQYSGTYNIADTQLVSLEQLLSTIRNSTGNRAKLIPIPESTRKGLFSNLEIDTSLLQKTFSWAPSLATLDAIELQFHK